MPPPAHEASFPICERSSSTTSHCALASSRAVIMPITPAPTITTFIPLISYTHWLQMRMVTHEPSIKNFQLTHRKRICHVSFTKHKPFTKRTGTNPVRTHHNAGDPLLAGRPQCSGDAASHKEGARTGCHQSPADCHSGNPAPGSEWPQDHDALPHSKWHHV